MYRDRLITTEVQTENAHRLKRLLLEYHDFRQLKANHPQQEDTRKLADWQAERLKTTHQDLYQHPGYHTGLEFLLSAQLPPLVHLQLNQITVPDYHLSQLDSVQG